MFPGESHAALVVQHNGQLNGRGQTIELIIDGGVRHSAELPSGAIRLHLSFAPGGMCHFGYSVRRGEEIPIPVAFQVRRGRWVGAKVGLLALASDPGAQGHADFDHFRFMGT